MEYTSTCLYIRAFWATLIHFVTQSLTGDAIAGGAEYGGKGTFATLAAVPFSYEDAGSATTAASSAAAEVAVLDRLPDEPFLPSFSIPEELAGRCPETEREHKVHPAALKVYASVAMYVLV